MNFRALPGASSVVPRPLVSVGVAGLDETALECLVDTGSLHNRFGAWVAHEAGIELSGADPTSIGVGGRPVIARTVEVAMSLGEWTWAAPISFCEPWPWDFNLLGQEGFLRWFRIELEVANRWMDISAHP